MNNFYFYCKFYSIFRNYGMPMWVLTPFRRIIRSKVNKELPIYLSKPYSNNSKNTEVVVSFTSFPARINNVWQVVECMLRQTLRPQKILLWLSKEQFPTIESIPETLRKRVNNIFEIHLVDGDIRSHKKYLYASRIYPRTPLLLIDDDIYYPTDFLEKMYSEYRRSGCVICHYGFIISYENNGNIASYSSWKELYSYCDSDDFFFGSGGGVLFRPECLYKDLTNIDLALSLTPLADDIWLNAMVRLAGLKTIKIKSGLLLPVDNGGANVTLADHNLSQGGNDKQLQAINAYYEKAIGKKVFDKSLL